MSRQTCRHILRIILYFIILAIPLFAQDNFEQRFREGVRIYRAGLYTDANHYFRDLHKEFPDNIRILHMLGRIALAREQWKDALEWNEKILKIAPKDLDSHLHSAIALREMGKYKAFVLRKKDWSNSEGHFRFVLDSLEYYKDTFLQYALLERYRRNYAAAIELAQAQIDREESTQAAVMMHQFYESFVYNEGLKGLAEWAANKEHPVTKLFIAEGYRLEKKYVLADSMFHALEHASAPGFSLVPLYIDLAKSKVEQGQEDSCQYYYKKALSSISNSLDAQLLFEDMKYILSDAEYEHYLGLENALQRKDFFQKLWIKRNPMPASDVNYRMVEHVRRVAYAERNFYYDGFRLPFNNPDRLNVLQFPLVFDLNTKFNDKGLIYIRHGEPDDRAFTVGGGPLNESWLYYPRGSLNKKLIFHFWQGDTQSGQNWRFIPSIPPYLAESRSNFDHLYSRMLTADPLEAISIQHQMEQASKENVKIGLNTDQHRWTKKLRSLFFPFYLASFRDNRGTTRCELYFSLKKEDVLPKSVAHTVEDSVTINFAVFDQDYNTLKHQVLFVPIKTIIDSTASMGFWPAQLNYNAQAGVRQFALNIRTPDDEAIGGYKFRFGIADYMAAGLKMSGLELAASIHATSDSGDFVKDGLQVIPNASKVYSSKEKVNIYFELYNLNASPGHAMPFFIEYKVRLLEERRKGAFAALAGLFRKRQPMISNKIERSTSSDMSREFLALDLAKQVPGVYELIVEATVPATNERVSRKINFELQ